jgi:hypothetical protein
MKLIKNFLLNDIYDDNDIMPNKNKIILSTTSFWILNLISHSYYNKLYFLTLNISLIAIASSIYWYKYKNNSIYHKCDKYLVIVCFAYLFINMNIIKFISNFICIIPPYILSSVFSIYNNYELQLYSHLIFRLFSFKLIYDFIINDINYFLIIAIENIIFNIYLINFIKNDIDNNITHYINYSFKVITIVFLNDFYYHYHYHYHYHLK